jgi:putative SOS response-associated peptidase YedK
MTWCFFVVQAANRSSAFSATLGGTGLLRVEAETVVKLPSFRDAFERRLCVVPADGFYEWRGPKAMREPLWIHPADGGLLLFAGLYEAWQPRGSFYLWPRNCAPRAKRAGWLQSVPVRC